MDAQMERTESTHSVDSGEREAIAPGIDARRLRGAMAEAKVKPWQVAQLAGISSEFVRKVAREDLQPGFATRAKLAYAVKALNLDPEHVLIDPPAAQVQETDQQRSGDS